ncbi:polymorphic outer membrane protein [Methanobacterium lacus]|uniref:Polymorphic outer membrane protein n=1 Tax=Methanobacterium lacus (strain AL-21) TaxID=877455 RepID=F0T8H8_METLA|nr:Ig-like domain-containing protein [Methanobacterium lacus]ADZ09729.1 polymorphic outer membrane protein [Methanobacterium lacus]
MGIFLFSVGVGSVSAATTVNNSTIYVNTAGSDTSDGQSAVYNGTSGPKKTIKNATGTVANHGTIYISKGTYKEYNITINTNMTIIGDNQSNTFIDAQGLGNIFNITPGLHITLINLTLKNGNSTDFGGAINNPGSDGILNITNSTFKNNTANVAGAISNEGTLTVTNSTFNSNNATEGGGAIFSSGKLTIENNIFTNNYSNYGGALYCSGIVTETNNIFTNNSATSSGGVIYINGNLISINDKFENNNAANGGVIYNDDTVTFINDQITNNTAANGGVIYNNGAVTVINDKFINNTAANGGIIYNYNGSSIVTGCTITNNTSISNGGIIYNDGGKAVIGFNWIVGNSNMVIYSTGGSVNANLNWWGSNSDPSVHVNSNVDLTSWLVLTIHANPSAIPNNGNSTVTVDLLHSNTGTLLTGNLPSGIPVTFTTNLGTMGSSASLTDGSAQSQLKSGSKAGTATISATIDNQTVKTQVIIKDTIPPTASASPKGGLYNTTKTVTLKMSEAGKIYYTLNGTTPTSNSTLYTKPISITKTTTLKYLAMDLADNKSPVYTQKYTIDKTAPKVSSTSPKNGTTGISKTSTVTIKFNENIQTSTNINKITIKNQTTGKYITVTKTIKGNTLTIKTTKKSAKTWYTITIPKGAIKDIAGNNLTVNYSFKFQTGK